MSTFNSDQAQRAQQHSEHHGTNHDGDAEVGIAEDGQELHVLPLSVQYPYANPAEQHALNNSYGYTAFHRFQGVQETSFEYGNTYTGLTLDASEYLSSPHATGLESVDTCISTTSTWQANPMDYGPFSQRGILQSPAYAMNVTPVQNDNATSQHRLSDMNLPQNDEEYGLPQHQNPSPRFPSHLRFQSWKEAAASIPVPTWRCPSPDTTLPTTDEHRQYWVRRLITAIKNTNQVCDAQSAAYSKRWNSSSNNTHPFYSALDIELTSWDVLALAEALHTTGPRVLLSFDILFWQSAVKSRNWTFAQRMEKIVELLMYSKARCEKLMAAQSTQAVVANPDALLKMTRQNCRQNMKRQAFLVAGRKKLNA